jgi:hypothetical protein
MNCCFLHYELLLQHDFMSAASAGTAVQAFHSRRWQALWQWLSSNQLYSGFAPQLTWTFQQLNPPTE